MNTKDPSGENYLYGASLILGSLLLFISSFFWIDGEYTSTGGSILIISNVFWILGYVGIFKLLRPGFPLLSNILLVVAIYGCMGGASFGFRGIYSEMFHLSKETLMSAWTKSPLIFNTTSFWPGPLIPLTLFVLGILFIKTRILKLWLGILLCLGALSFPIGRITRTETLAHVSDLMLLIPTLYLGSYLIRRKNINNDIHIPESSSIK